MRKITYCLGLAVAVAVAALGSALPANADPTDGQVVRIGTVDAKGFATATETTQGVFLREKADDKLQWWQFTLDPKASVTAWRVTNVATKGCLTFFGFGTTTNPAVIQRPCANTADELWQTKAIVTVGQTPVYLVRNLSTDLCLGAERFSTGQSGQLRLFPCDPLAAHQQFILPPV